MIQVFICYVRSEPMNLLRKNKIQTIIQNTSTNSTRDADHISISSRSGRGNRRIAAMPLICASSVHS